MRRPIAEHQLKKWIGESWPFTSGICELFSPPFSRSFWPASSGALRTSVRHTETVLGDAVSDKDLARMNPDGNGSGRTDSLATVPCITVGSAIGRLRERALPSRSSRDSQPGRSGGQRPAPHTAITPSSPTTPSPSAASARPTDAASVCRPQEQFSRNDGATNRPLRMEDTQLDVT